MGELASITFIILEIIAFIYLNDAFFDLKSKKVLAISVVTMFALQNFYLFHLSFNNILNIFISFLLLNIISFISYTGTWQKKILLSSIYLVCVYSIDSLTFFFNMMFFSISYDELVGDMIFYITTGIISKFSLILIAYSIKKHFISKRKNTNISFFQWAASFSFSVYALVNLYAAMSEALRFDEISMLLIINNIAVISCNIFLFYIIDQLEEENESKNKSAILQEQVKIEMENSTELSNAYAAQRSITHDFNNHLSIIQSLISNGEIIQAERHINNVLGEINENLLFVNTNNPIIDALLTRKYTLAKSKGIDMQIISNDLSVMPIRTKDLVLILINVIDNAIEASSKCEKERIIKFRIIESEDDIVLSVQNTCINTLKKTEEGLITSKSDKINHGYGLKIVGETLKKYDLEHSISIYDGWFRFSVLIPI